MIAALPIVALALAQVVAAATPPPALVAFGHAWSGVSSYTAKLTMHETAGSATQDRTYDYPFSKPTSATIAVAGGPGRSGSAAWAGGDSVIGSPPGLLHGVKVRLSIHDGRVTTLRGDTIDIASFGWVSEHLQGTPGRLSEAPGAPAPGAAAHETELDLRVADPAANGGIGEERVLLSNATNLPLRVRRYAGTTLVKEVGYAAVNVR